MKNRRTVSLILTVLLAVCCISASAEETPAFTAPGMITFTAEEGPEEGVQLTRWACNGTEAAEFLSILLPLPEGFPIRIGTMYEGPEAALLTGTLRGDAESGTAEVLLVTADGETEPVLTLMYARDRVSLLELDEDLADFCYYDETAELWLAAFAEEDVLSFNAAAMRLEGFAETCSLTPVIACYGLDPAAVMDLRVPYDW